MKYRSWILSLGLSVTTMIASGAGPGAAVTPASPAVAAGSGAAKPSLSVNIDDPQFHRLKTALVPFSVEAPQAGALALDSLVELERLLLFTGFFSLQLQNQPVLPSNQPQLDAWKKVGLEVALFGKLISPTPGRLALELNTLDMISGQQVISRTYEISAQGHDFHSDLKEYVDRILMHFTSRPGIFSSKIVFVGRKNRDSQKEIYIADPDGRNVEQITTHNSLHLSPSWSPDGSKIIFTSYRNKNPDLFLYDRATQKTTTLSHLPGINSGGVFSPNGKIIVFTGSVNGNSNLYVTTPHGGIRKPFMPGSGLEVDPMFSPNGKWIAFVSGRFGNPHIFRGTLNWNADMSAVTQVTEELRITYAGWYNATPVWSPDSDKFTFASFDREVGRFDLFMINNDGSKMERLTLNLADNQSPTWSPNGQMILFHSNRIGNSNVKGRNQLYFMNRDGSRQTMIETGLFEAETPKWGPFIPPHDAAPVAISPAPVAGAAGR